MHCTRKPLETGLNPLAIERSGILLSYDLWTDHQESEFKNYGCRIALCQHFNCWTQLIKATIRLWYFAWCCARKSPLSHHWARILEIVSVLNQSIIQPKVLVREQARMGLMGKLPWCYTTTSLCNSMEIQMEMCVLAHGSYGQMTLALHYNRTRKFYKTSKGGNPSIYFRYTLCPHWPMCKPIWASEKMPMTLHNYRSKQFRRTLNRVNLSSGFTDLRSINLDPTGIRFGPCASPCMASGYMTITLRSFGGFRDRYYCS